VGEGVVYFGRVRHEDPWDSTPVRVALSWPGGPRVEAETDEQGQYELARVPRPAEPVLATVHLSQVDRVTQRLVPLLRLVPDRWRLPDIELGAAGTLAVRVQSRGHAEGGAVVFVSAGGTDFWMQATTDADGVATFAGVPEGNILALARGIDGERGFAFGRVPQTPEVEIELRPVQTVRVHVVADENDAPVEGAEVLVGSPLHPAPHGPGMLPPVPTAVTDSRGEATVERISGAQASVVVYSRALGRTSGLASWRFLRIPLDATDLTVRLVAPQVLQFPVEGAVPGPDASLTVTTIVTYHSWMDPELRAWIEDDVLHVGPLPAGRNGGEIEASDGSYAEWSTDHDGKPVVFRARRRLVIKAQWPDGAPAAGQPLAALAGGTSSPWVTTSEAGLATFEGLKDDSVWVRWRIGSNGGLNIDQLLIRDEVGSVTLPKLAHYAVEVVRHDRDASTAYVEAAPYPHPSQHELGWMAFQPVGELTGASGTQLQFDWYERADGEPVALSVRSSDPDTTHVVAWPVRDGLGVWRARVALEPIQRLDARVVPPADGVYSVGLEAFGAANGSAPVFVPQTLVEQARFAEDGVHRFRGLPPAFYRVHDRKSGEATALVPVREGSEPVVVTLDLSDVVEVKGRVEVPSPHEAKLVTVALQGRDSGPFSRASPVRVSPSGAFTLRARRGSRLRLVASHPFLSQLGGPAEHVVGTGDVVLVMAAERPLVRFRRPEADPSADMRDTAPDVLQVQVSAPGAGFDDSSYVPLGVNRRSCTFAMPQAGTYDVRVLCHGHVPVTFRRLEVPREGVDLGSLSLDRGATVVLRLLAGQEPLSAWLAASATRQGDDAYLADSGAMLPGDPPRFVITGLAPGRFHVRVVRLATDGPALFESYIESDGRSIVTLDVQLP